MEDDIMRECDVLIIGGGAAGMTAAYAIWKRNPRIHVVLAERSDCLGGVLRQCVHQGFGRGYFGEDLTGVEFADRLEAMLKKTHTDIWLNTEAVRIGELQEISQTEALPDKSIWLARRGGPECVHFRFLILAAGCRERAVGSLGICGTRPAGVFMAGQLQRMMNLGHYDPGREAVIFGSGDIGLIMARQLVLAGKTVKCVVEIQPQSPAMERNRRQCLEAFRIPFKAQTRVIRLYGENRLQGVMVENIVSGEEEYIECDMLVIAAGLIPDRTVLGMDGKRERQEKFPPWLYLCGNCAYIHPIVDRICIEAEQTGAAVAKLLADDC